MNRVFRDHQEVENAEGLNRRAFLKVMLVGGAGAAIVACTPTGTATEAPTVVEPTDAPSPTDAPAEEPVEVEPDEVAVLRVGWSGAPSALDPLNASADVEIAFLTHVYDYLIDTNAQSELVPRLATAWDVSEDGLVYTLTLAEGVKFHNGDDLSADDVVWTLNRAAGPDAATSDLFAGASFEASGSQVIITLSAPQPDFLYNISDNRMLILQADAADIGDAFNGTGPFKLVEYIAEDRAVLEANEDYFGGRPSIERLEFIYFGDTEAAINALRSEVVDVVLRMDNATFLGIAGEGAYNTVDIPTNGHDLVRLRADRAPGDNEQVRLAFKMATDRNAVFERIQLGFGAPGRDTPIGPLYGAYYTEEFDLPAYDPEGARTLLADAGYPDGLEMTLVVPNARGLPDLAQVLAAQWAEAGITVEIDVQEESVYYADGGWLEVDLAVTPWGSRPVPQIYLDVAYKTDAMWNEAHFSDPELDEMITLAGSSLDPAERVAAYKEIQRILVERGPVIIPYFFAQLGVFAPNVEGVELHPFAGRTRFHQATVS